MGTVGKCHTTIPSVIPPVRIFQGEKLVDKNRLSLSVRVSISDSTYNTGIMSQKLPAILHSCSNQCGIKFERLRAFTFQCLKNSALFDLNAI